VTFLTSEIRAVFFDAVGTVLFPNPSAPSVYAEVARRGDLDERFVQAYRIEEAIDRSTGWVVSEERERRRWRNIVFASPAGASDLDARFEELFLHFALPTSWILGPDVGPTIDVLIERGIAVGMGSNYDSRLHSVVAGFPELEPLRNRTVVSSEVGFRKPSAEFFREVIRKAGCEAREILFVGDDLDNDYRGALAVGIHPLLLDTRLESAVPNRIAKLLGLLTPPND
jgi:putative hydrolase of the HAD superfamily